MDHLRVGDSERDAATAALSEHYAAGRLTKEEFDERSDAAWSARTRHDLDVLFVDLPGRPAAAPVRRPQRARAPWRAVLLPVAVVLVVLTVITHLPLILFGLLVWFCLSRFVLHRHGHRRPTRDVTRSRW